MDFFRISCNNSYINLLSEIIFLHKNNIKSIEDQIPHQPVKLIILREGSQSFADSFTGFKLKGDPRLNKCNNYQICKHRDIKLLTLEII